MGIIAILDAPEIILTKEDNAGDVLVKFYRALGWNGEDELNSWKVRTTNAVYDRLFDLMLEKYPDTVGIGLVMIDKAPGVDKNIPPNKVHLLEGWVKPSEGVTAK
jgi:hypothetical protein